MCLLAFILLLMEKNTLCTSQLCMNLSLLKRVQTEVNKKNRESKLT